MHDTDQQRWKFTDPMLLYLFPASYVAHVLEESLVNAPLLLWTVRVDPPVATRPFLLGSAVAFGLMVCGIRLVARGTAFHWIVPALATAVLLNTTGHLAGSFAGRTYSAGLMTAMVLWMPLALLTLVRVWDQTSTRTLWAGVLVGVVIEALVAMFSTLSNLFASAPV